MRSPVGAEHRDARAARGRRPVATTWALRCTSIPAARRRSLAFPTFGEGSTTITWAPAACKRLGRLVARMVRREHDDALPDQHAEALEVGPGGRGEHHARTVVRRRTRAAARARRRRARPARRGRGGSRRSRRRADSTRRSRRRRSRPRSCSPGSSTPAGGSSTTWCSSTSSTRPPAAAASQRRDPAGGPAPITSTSTCRCRWRAGRGVDRRLGQHVRHPPGCVTTKPSTRLTIVAGRIGSNHGAVISTNAFGSSTPAVTTPRGRPCDRRDEPGALARGEQRARHRVAREAVDVAAVERERGSGRDRSIQVPPGLEPASGHAGGSSPWR